MSTVTDDENLSVEMKQMIQKKGFVLVVAVFMKKNFKNKKPSHLKKA